MRKIAIIALVILCSLSGFAQNQMSTLKGVLVDSISGLPIVQATVFVPFTTHGTTSNSKGEFILSKLPKGPLKIAIRHLGYNPVSLEINIQGKEQRLKTIRISPTTLQLEEITKVGSHVDQFKSLLLFKKHFLGNTRGNTCEIKNPDDLFFYKEDGVLHASVRKPLKIINRYLGYEITYFLDEYKLMVHHIPHDSLARQKAIDAAHPSDRVKVSRTLPVNTAKDLYYQTFSGLALYKDLSKGKSVRGLNWRLNREAEFRGNLRHFLITLHRGELEKSNYQLVPAWDKSGKPEASDHIEIDSLFFWDHHLNKPSFLYYNKSAKGIMKNELVGANDKQKSDCIMYDQAILVVYDVVQSLSIKDDRVAELNLKGKPLCFDAYGSIKSVAEDARLWIYHDSNVKLRVLLPNDFLPKGFLEK